MDIFTAPVVGLVSVSRGRDRVFQGVNSVTDALLETILRAIMETDGLRAVIVASTGSVPTSATTGLPNVVATALLASTGDLAPSQYPDAAHLVSVGTVRALLDPPQAVTFDTLGLVSHSGALVAAIAIAPVTTVPGEPLLVEWTLALRGPGTYQALATA